MHKSLNQHLPWTLIYEKKKKALGTDKYKVADNESKFKIDININLTRISSGHDKEKRLIFTGKNTLLIEVLEAIFC